MLQGTPVDISRCKSFLLKLGNVDKIDGLPGLDHDRDQRERPMPAEVVSFQVNVEVWSCAVACWQGVWKGLQARGGVHEVCFHV